MTLKQALYKLRDHFNDNANNSTGDESQIYATIAQNLDVVADQITVPPVQTGLSPVALGTRGIAVVMQLQEEGFDGKQQLAILRAALGLLRA